MRIDFYTKTILTVVACLLGILVLRPMLTPVSAQAQGSSDFYIEPGVASIRKPDGTAQLPGKLVINRDSPYPINATTSEPPVATPVYLSKFDFSKVRP